MGWRHGYHDSLIYLVGFFSFEGSLHPQSDVDAPTQHVQSYDPAILLSFFFGLLDHLIDDHQDLNLKKVISG